LLTVSSIERGVVTSPNIDIGLGGGIVYADDGAGGSAGQITGILYGIQAISATTSTAGTIDFFWHPVNATYVVPTCVSGATCAPDAAAVALFTSGTLLARVKLASGIDPGNPLTFTIASAAVTPGALGQFSSFAEVDTTTAGAWTTALNGDWFTTSFGTRDIRLNTSFVANVAPWSLSSAGIVGIRSNDPLRVFTR
jgi:hypothetical protein